MTADPTEAARVSSPKLFVSYSWTSPDHEEWVLRLATDLRESGIDVILDKWDLKEGHDAHAFMEKMVTDPEIRKVILVCDKSYVEKTDGRTGGVGTEAQIISSEIYEKQEQDKFVAVVKERDEKGKACLPAYYRSRIYIDLSNPETYAEDFEKLLRWAFNQPLYRKPELGEKPPFLLSESEGGVPLSTSARLRRALEALRNGRVYALPATSEYFRVLCEEMEKLRISNQADPFDDAVVQSIESFLPYRNEAVDVFVNLATHVDNLESRTVLHRFFEQTLPYMDRPEHVTTFRNWDWDNFRFVIHELFLYAVAVLIRYERFESASYLMSNRYYVSNRSRLDDPMVSFVTLRQYMESLAYRKQRLKLNRLSLRADILKERCKQVGIEFRHLMQADFVLFLRAALDNAVGIGGWFPETLVFHHQGPFEVFARSRSKGYFSRAKVILGIDEKDALAPLLKTFAGSPQHFPHWQHESFNAAYLLGFDQIATTP
jgi:SEFIR domain